MITFQIAGTKELSDGKAGGGENLGVDVTVKTAIDVSRVRAAGQPEVFEAESDDLIELEMEGGAILWLRADEVEDRLGPISARSADGQAIILPTAIAQEGDARGIGDWVIKGLKVIGIDLRDELAEKTARAIARKLEEKATKDDPGLKRWDGSETLTPADEIVPGDQPWLLFLHGTASNTVGSFGDLATVQASVWRAINDAYEHGEHILAFEHRSLTESPITNALDLVKALPVGIELHLVSHSRGGLIGELLGRGRLVDRDGEARPPFDAADLALFEKPEYKAELKALKELGALLSEKRIKVSRFVRVACPARGTSLMRGRLDRWLNLLFDAASLAIGGRLNPVVETLLGGLRDLVQATVKERTDPETLPGLEAMAPELSPLLKMLNRKQIEQADDLRVIAGDIEPSGVFRRLGIWFADLYFGDDHDLVVDTSSMDGGAARPDKAPVFLDRGKSVSHFNYFANSSSASALSKALTLSSAEARSIGRDLSRAADVKMPELTTRSAGDLPIVFLLPGISGSHLTIGDDRIWIDPIDLAFGGVAKLAIDNPQVEPEALIGLYYGKLAKFLDGSHDVRPWAYDWRRSLLETGRLFARELRKALATKSDQEVRIVAHSMGGLVARAAFALDQDLWETFKARKGCRLIMLGTPNGGSFSIPMLLLGRNKLMGYLALLDFKASRRDHLKVISDWPGALQMLPAERDELFETKGWTALDKADPGEKWVKPDGDTLREAKAFRKLIEGAPIDRERMFYIAGQADTFSGMTVDESGGKDEAIRFQISPEGDGQVLWSTGIPKGIKVWFTHAVHGDLARHRRAFPAILDILERGTTDKLPTEKPAVSRSPHLPAEIAAETVAVVPSMEHLLAAATGASLAFEPVSEERQVAIEITHGHLAFARHPVMVGHYIGDSLNGTELVLDRRQSGRIAKRRRLGLHPGPIGTNDVHLNDAKQPTGSVIIGLGAISDLTSGKLQQTVQQGLLELAATTLEERQKQRGKNALPAAASEPLGVSCVLVGTGEGVVAVQDCVVAIMRAMKNANRLLGDEGFAHLEIIELIEQRAIGAWHAVQKWLKRAEFQGSFSLDQPIRESKGGQRRIGPEDDPLWWTPVTITSVDDEAEVSGPFGLKRPKDRRALKYVAIAGRARAEADLVAHQRSLVERYVQRITRRQVEKGAASPARTLFELLWPNRLKEQSLDDRNLRLILDESSAALPWEMMDDRRPWTGATGGDGKDDFGPPVTRFGVIRQLMAMNFRRTTPKVNGGKALVIGDPLGETSGLAALPGAQREAETVATALEARGYDVTRLIGKDVWPEDVISELFAHAWQIVHIAAHGVVDYAFPSDPLREKKTGVVLGGSMVLDAEILEQMPVPPDLVFVNCCLLGSIDPSEENQYLRSDRPALASSVAVQLIKMGVRAVVAAGWEVGDTSAELFAKTLYAGLLDGGTFGEVTQEARHEVHAAFPSDSTWGAYQCYGHPDFELHPLQAGQRHDPELPVFASPHEAIAAVERITVMGEVGGERDERADLDELTRIEKRVAELGWLGHAALRAALADAHAGLEAFETAIEHYAAAALAEDASVPVRAIEQRLNLMSRRAADSVEDDESLRETSIAGVGDSIDKLEKLIDVFGKTQERLSLIGGAHKRMARLTSGNERTKHLDRMKDYCREAKEHAQRRGGGNVFYPWSQELSAQVAIKLRTRRSPKLDFAGIRQLAPGGDHDDFWQLVQPADLMLLERAADEHLSETDLDDIHAAYMRAWNHMGRQRELSSIFGQIDFLRTMLTDKIDTNKRLKAFSDGLDTLRNRLAQQTQI